MKYFKKKSPVLNALIKTWPKMLNKHTCLKNKRRPGRTIKGDEKYLKTLNKHTCLKSKRRPGRTINGDERFLKTLK